MWTFTVLPAHSRQCCGVTLLYPSPHTCAYRSSWSIPSVGGFEAESTCVVKLVFAGFVDVIGDRCFYCLNGHFCHYDRGWASFHVFRSFFF